MPPPELVLIFQRELLHRHVNIVHWLWSEWRTEEHVILNVYLIVRIFPIHISHWKDINFIKRSVDLWVRKFEPKLNSAFWLPHLLARGVESEIAIRSLQIQSHVTVITCNAIELVCSFEGTCVVVWIWSLVESEGHGWWFWNGQIWR